MNVNLTPNITGKNVNIIKGATQADLTNSVNNSKTYRDEAEAFSIVSEAKSVEASYSALNASISSTAISDKATIATTKANEANNSAINASASETVCIAKATIATDNADIAIAQAVIATNKATEANTSANTANTQANIAITKASEASISAINALTSENNASTSEANALLYENHAKGYADSIAIANIDTIEDLPNIDTSLYTTVIVKDLNRGGTFVWSPTGIANGGTVFAGATGYWNRQFAGAVNVKWFGAVGNTTDGTDGADDTEAFKSAILMLASNQGGTVTMDTSKYSILGTVVVPSTIKLDLNNSFIYGNGVGATNDLFQSGTIVNGNIESNIGKPPETALATKMGISNGTILNTGKALNLYNCIWQTEFKDLEFINCTWAMYVSRCFYSRFINLISRGTAGFATNAAFEFVEAVNVQQMESIQVTDRILGMRIAGGANGLGLYNCSAESCGTGVIVEDTTGPITFNSCYYELNTVVGVDVNTATHKNSVAFIGCFFNDNSNVEGTAIGIRGNAGGVGTYSSIIVDRSCYFQSNNVDIDCSSNSYYNQDVIEYSQILNSAYSTLPVFPSKIKAGIGANVNIFQNAQGSAGIPILKSKIHGNSLIPFHYEGTAGNPTTNSNGFMAITRDSSVPTAYIATIDTDLDATGVANMFVYNILVSDTQDASYFRGFIFGTTKQELFTTAGKTITVNNNNGNIQIVLTPFNGAANIQAVIRHI